MTESEVRRGAAASQIDPDTAEVWFEHRQVLDPYGERVLPPEEDCVGRVFFAMDPDERVPVAFYDLPEATREALEERRAQADAEGWREIMSAIS